MAASILLIHLIKKGSLMSIVKLGNLHEMGLTLKKNLQETKRASNQRIKDTQKIALQKPATMLITNLGGQWRHAINRISARFNSYCR